MASQRKQVRRGEDIEDISGTTDWVGLSDTHPSPPPSNGNTPFPGLQGGDTADREEVRDAPEPDTDTGPEPWASTQTPMPRVENQTQPGNESHSADLEMESTQDKGRMKEKWQHFWLKNKKIKTHRLSRGAEAIPGGDPDAEP